MDVNFYSDVISLLKRNSDKIDNFEIEVKIKKDINIPLLEEKLISLNYKLKESLEIDYIYKDERITFRERKYYDTSKVNVYTKFFKKYKLTVSIEKENLLDINIIPKHDLIRRKYRKSYIKDNLSVDITTVDDKKIELEVEVIDAKLFDYKKLNKVLELIDEQNSDLIEDFTKATGRIEDNLYNVHRFFSKARDLEIKDLKNDGILKPFTVSLKADGTTNFLYFHSAGVYLIDINKEKIDKIDKKRELVDTLYVGEIINGEKLKKNIEEKFLFLPYDCLRYNNVDIRNLNYIIRFSKCENVYDLKLPKIKIQKKEILTYNSNTESFNNAVIKSFENMKKVNYYTDGIIFTPVKSPYIAKGQHLRKNEQHKRSLSNYLDVCKYKLPDDLTIDLLTKEDGVYSNIGKFKGRDIFKYTDKDIGKIIEFKPYSEEDKIIYKVNRIREDKTNPNNINVVNILWKLRHDPIELKTIEGKDLKLMRKYHNVIKRERIIDKLSGLVVDIGSGVGGDLDKYLKNEKIKDVLFIEPNKDFITEFERRKSQLKLKGKNFHIIRAGGEETSKIIKSFEEYILPIKENGDNLNINMMISLSFFWSDKKMLKSLSDTINSMVKLFGEGNIYFNFLTIEGKRLNELFKELGDNIQLNNVFLKRLGENEVYVDIKDSKTVEAQTEYFVYLEKLFDLIDFEILELKEADGNQKDDYILSKNEKIYSSLFVYGSAQHFKEFNYESLKVSETKGEKKEGVLQSFGDDKLVKLDRKIKDKLSLENLYRSSVMKKGGSLNHSLLKILNESYRKADIYERIKMAKKLNIKNFDKIPYKVVVLSAEGIEEYNKEKEKSIYLLKNNTYNYEPIFQKEGENIKRIF